MATSGTFTGSRGGSSTGPYLSLHWTRITEDIANNRSELRLTLKLHADYSINFSADKSGNLEGTSFTYTNNVSGAGTYTLKTKDMWVNHNSDGSKSITLDGSFNIAIYWGSSYVSSLSVSGTATIDTIPRASDFTAFALNDQYLAVSQANQVNYTLDRKASSFSHTMTLKAGGTTIKSWTDSGTGVRTQSLSASEVNAILNKAPNDDGITLYLTMQTKSGSTNIGSAVTRSDWVGMEASVKPSASGLSVSIYGSGRDKTINKYVQGISKVTASFTRTAGYGASISSSKIVVKRQSDGGNSQTISSHSGTTANPVSLSGTYIITATVTDSRGRTDSVSTTITVDAYSPPKISTFKTARQSGTTTNVNATISATWSPMGTSNPATITIKGVKNDGTTQTLYTLTSSTAGSINTTQVYGSQSDASSYEYTMEVVDTFSKKATSVSKLGTSFIELTISKGKGIGVGKVHERGSMDIKGEVFLEGTIHLPLNSYRSTSNGGGLNANNGDVYGLNGIWFGIDGGDTANNNGEGLLFPRSDTPADSRSNADWDNLRVLDRTLLLNGSPIATSDSEILWEGGYYMTSGHTVTPSKKITDCPNGWVLVWSDYDTSTKTTNRYDNNYVYIPKAHMIRASGQGVYSIISGGTTEAQLTFKYTYINASTITGNDANDDSGTQQDIVLRQVLSF